MDTGLPRRARIALPGAALGVALLALTWYLAHYVAFARHADLVILQGFSGLGRPRLDRLTHFVAGLCDPQKYVVLAAVPVIVALVRRRPQVAVMIVLVLLCANVTTQLLKPMLAAPRDIDYLSPINAASWPSGHATASMSLALCGVIAAPPRRRPLVAALMGGFAIAVCYSFLELSWHYPSDVFGGFLVAGTWMLLGIAGLAVYEARRAGADPADAADAARGRARGATVTIGQALTPLTVMLVAAGLCAGLVLVARPAPVIAYARGHETFIVGAAAIGALGVMLASGLALWLERVDN